VEHFLIEGGYETLPRVRRRPILADQHDIIAVTTRVAEAEAQAASVGLPPLRFDLPLNEVLQLRLRQLNPPGAYLVRPGYLEVTIAKRAQGEREGHGESPAP
jgi:hypothetical protein